MRLPKGYYVYGHKDVNTGLWIYIGKGKDGRCFDITDRSEKHKEYLVNNEIEVVIFKDELTQDEAFRYEEEKIEELVNEGYGLDMGDYRIAEKVLFNKCLGGPGAKGIVSDGARAVICVTTGIEYPSIKGCAKELGIDYRRITKVCKGNAKGANLNGSRHVFKYKYPTKEEEVAWNERQSKENGNKGKSKPKKTSKETDYIASILKRYEDKFFV